jgi:hypothetical protein
MPERERDFLGWGVAVARGEEDQAARRPPAGLPGELHVTALGQRRGCDQRSEDPGQQARGRLAWYDSPGSASGSRWPGASSAVRSSLRYLVRSLAMSRRAWRRVAGPVHVRGRDLLVRHVVRPAPGHVPQPAGAGQLVAGRIGCWSR